MLGCLGFIVLINGGCLTPAAVDLVTPFMSGALGLYISSVYPHYPHPLEMRRCPTACKCCCSNPRYGEPFDRPLPPFFISSPFRDKESLLVLTQTSQSTPPIPAGETLWECCCSVLDVPPHVYYRCWEPQFIITWLPRRMVKIILPNNQQKKTPNARRASIATDRWWIEVKIRGNMLHRERFFYILVLAYASTSNLFHVVVQQVWTNPQYVSKYINIVCIWLHRA